MEGGRLLSTRYSEDSDQKRGVLGDFHGRAGADFSSAWEKLAKSLQCYQLLGLPWDVVSSPS